MCRACSLSLETLTLTGLSASREHLLVSYPNVLYTPHAWSSCDLGLSGIWVLTHTICGAQLTLPIITVGPSRSYVDVWCRPLLQPRSEVWLVQSFERLCGFGVGLNCGFKGFWRLLSTWEEQLRALATWVPLKAQRRDTWNTGWTREANGKRSL